MKRTAILLLGLLCLLPIAAPAQNTCSGQPPGTSYRSLAAQARAAGFTGTTTSWKIGNVLGGSLKFGTFNPCGTTVETRYGDNGVMRFGPNPNNYVGSHSAGPNALADQYAGKVLSFDPQKVVGRTIVGDPWWQYDLNYVDGLSAWVMARARDLRLLDGQTPAPNGGTPTCAPCPKCPTCPAPPTPAPDVCTTLRVRSRGSAPPPPLGSSGRVTVEVLSEGPCP